MKVLRTPTEIHAWRDSVRPGGGTVGLVPTMGSLHAGHVSLLAEARRANDLVVMSLFVNPTQFGSRDDLSKYPRNERGDLEVATEAGVDVVYAPTPDLVYPAGFSSRVEVRELTEVLEGDDRGRGPEHFAGVTTVVAKLFNAIDPDRAYFGRKDAQQAAVIKRMVTDLEFRQEVVVLPTVRETDGLALSSRNSRLSPAERERALALSAGLFEAERVAETAGIDAGLTAGRRVLTDAGIEPEYFELRDPDTLEPIAEGARGPAMIVVAARVGGVRLIDNVLIETNQPARSIR